MSEHSDSAVSRRAFSVAVYARRGGASETAEVLIIKHKRLGTWLPVGGELQADEMPVEAAARELAEETGLRGTFPALAAHLDGVPRGYLGYEEHAAGSKGLHMNFVFVVDVERNAEIVPNNEFSEWRWVGRRELDLVESPLNVRQFGFMALDAE